MKSIFIAGLIFISTGALASRYYSPETPVHVKSYTRSDGTYVQPYYRAKPRERAENPYREYHEQTYKSDNYSSDYNSGYGSNGGYSY